MALDTLRTFPGLVAVSSVALVGAFLMGRAFNRPGHAHRVMPRLMHARGG
jgi:hypothetical protein